MKKLIIKVLCFSIFFNSLITIVARTVYSMENNNQKTIELKENKAEDKKNYFRDIDKNKACLFTTILVGIGTGAFIIFKHMKKIDNIDHSSIIEEEEEDISGEAVM